jgi:hypothetical protein
LLEGLPAVAECLFLPLPARAEEIETIVVEARRLLANQA